MVLIEEESEVPANCIPVLFAPPLFKAPRITLPTEGPYHSISHPFDCVQLTFLNPICMLDCELVAPSYLNCP